MNDILAVLKNTGTPEAEVDAPSISVFRELCVNAQTLVFSIEVSGVVRIWSVNVSTSSCQFVCLFNNVIRGQHSVLGPRLRGATPVGSCIALVESSDSQAVKYYSACEDPKVLSVTKVSMPVIELLTGLDGSTLGVITAGIFCVLAAEISGLVQIHSIAVDCPRLRVCGALSSRYLALGYSDHEVETPYTAVEKIVNATTDAMSMMATRVMDHLVKPRIAESSGGRDVGTETSTLTVHRIGGRPQVPVLSVDIRPHCGSMAGISHLSWSSCGLYLCLVSGRDLLIYSFVDSSEMSGYDCPRLAVHSIRNMSSIGRSLRAVRVTSFANLIITCEIGGTVCVSQSKAKSCVSRLPGQYLDVAPLASGIVVAVGTDLGLKFFQCGRGGGSEPMLLSHATLADYTYVFQDCKSKEISAETRDSDRLTNGVHLWTLPGLRLKYWHDGKPESKAKNDSGRMLSACVDTQDSLTVLPRVTRTNAASLHLAQVSALGKLPLDDMKQDTQVKRRSRLNAECLILND